MDTELLGLEQRMDRVEISEKCRESLDKMKEFTDQENSFSKRTPDFNSDYDRMFGEQFVGYDGNQTVDVQYYTGEQNEPPRELIVQEDGVTVKKDVMARMWVVDKKTNPPSTLCYDLTPNGDWYLSVSDTVRKGDPNNPNEKGKEVWKIRETRKITKEELQENVLDKLSKTKKTKAS